MRSTRWIGFLGVGVVLGACSGYSSLGELSNNGGQSGQDDGVGGSQSTGAKGGQGRGGTRTTGGAQGMGASPSMVGGSNGMGAVGGDGMGAVGGNSMGAVGGDGMGAAGSGSTPILCMSVDDCPSAPPACALCEDGTTTCPEPSCSNGVCGVYQPFCPGTEEPPRCMTDGDCPTAACAEDGVCPQYVCANGYCGLTLPNADPPCANRACGDPCMTAAGTAGTCDADSECTNGMPQCGSDLPTFACMSDGDCGVELDCLYCGEGVCADTACLEDRCELVCPTEFMCDSPMDCPKEASDDACSTGPWECVRGFCARQYQTCSAPAPMQ